MLKVQNIEKSYEPMKVRTIIFVFFKMQASAPHLFAEGAGSGAGHGAENLGKIVVVADTDLFGHGGDRQAALYKQPLSGADAPLSDELRQGLSAGQLLGQGAQLGAADVQVLGNGGQGQFFHIMLVQIQLQLLEIGLFCGQNHALELNIGGQGLQGLGIRLNLLLGALAELKKGVLQGFRPAGIPVQQGAGILPLRLYGGVVQIAAHSQIGQGMFFVIEGHNGLANAGVAAVELKAFFCGVMLDFAHIAGDAAFVALRQIVDYPAEGGMSPKQVDIPALRI